MENDKIELYSITDKMFQMQGIDVSYEDVTVVMPGYIITPNGEFIIVDSKRHHRDVFDEYLYKYLDKDHEPSDTITAIRKLNQLNHMVYCGIRTGAINSGYFSSNYGVGYVFTPNMEDITIKQRNALEALIATNVSPISKREILEIMFANTITDKEYNFNEFFNEFKTHKMK